MIWFALLAAQVAAPTPLNSDKWLFAEDTPQFLIDGPSGAWWVPVRMTISPTGKIESCEVEGTSGVAALDRFACALLFVRAKFEPARIDGAPNYGVYRLPVRWVVSDSPIDRGKLFVPDIELSVTRLPAGIRSPALVSVAFIVGADGLKSSCVPDESNGIKKVHNHPALIPIACDEVMSSYQAKPAQGPGKPVVSVQNASVEFSIGRSN